MITPMNANSFRKLWPLVAGAAATMTANAAALPISFTANLSDPVIAHGEVRPIAPNPEMIFDLSGNLIVHPFHGSIDGVYTRLTSRDAFDAVTGLELALGSGPGANGSHFISYAAPGHGLSATGATATDDNRVFLAARGLSLNISAPTDYFINPGTGLEYRIYRHGEFGLFEELAPNVYNQVLAYADVAVSIVINYGAGSIVGSLLGASPDSLGGLLPRVELDAFSTVSSDPIQVEGTTPLGRYAGWSFGGVNATFGDTISEVPEAGTGGVAAALMGLLLWRVQQGRTKRR